MCGEKSPLSKESVLEWGSPPRVRGKGEVVSRCGIKARITPACAGKRATPSGFRRPRRDHPRVCGEKPNRWPWTATLPGSPPRVRGKEYSRAPTYQPYGITPACAGKRIYATMGETGTGDHPRVCGEKQVQLPGLQPFKGSPPRVRGKAVPAPMLLTSAGITPACAGKSDSRRSQSCARRDHPRVCGEKLLSSTASCRQTGSPPRVRGKGGNGNVQIAQAGITPACAGKRLKRSHRIGHFSCILCLFHSVLHRASVSGGSRAGPCAPPCLPAQNAVPV